MRPLSARLSIRWWAATASSNGSTSISVSPSPAATAGQDEPPARCQQIDAVGAGRAADRVDDHVELLGRTVPTTRDAPS
jgi:hypothetical protein